MLTMHQDEVEREQFVRDLDESARQGARMTLAEAFEAEVQAYILNRLFAGRSGREVS